MYEKRRQPLASRAHFTRRVIRHWTLAFLVVAAALLIGILGYHILGKLGWLDSYLNAAMILGGMGPVDPLKTPGAKFFAGTYALFAGLVFITISGIILAPFLHRLMHLFHLDK
jgi:hypothetical protein